MFHQSVALLFFLRQGFWVIAVGVLLVGQLQVLPHFISSSAAEYSCSTFISLPSGYCFAAASTDNDENPDCLPLLTPQISPANPATLSCQQASPQLLASMIEGSFSLFARPPPVIPFGLFQLPQI